MCIVLPAGFRIAVNIAGRDFERQGPDDPKLPFPARGSGPGFITIATIAQQTYSPATRHCIQDPVLIILGATMRGFHALQASSVWPTSSRE